MFQEAEVGKRGRKGGKEAGTGSVNEQVTMGGTWGSVLQGPLGDGVEPATQVAHQGSKELYLSSISIHYWLRAALSAIQSNRHLE